MTCADGNRVEILYARACFGKGGTGSLCAGRFATEGDSGEVKKVGDAVSANSALVEYSHRHPGTDIDFRRIQIPYWGRMVEGGSSGG